jgi:hypothetical protein
VYGPEIRPTGLQIDGHKIEFVRRTSNLLDLTASAEAGSCPYLLSWSNVDREWMEHGKVLDEGLGAEREYTETVTFSGFRSHFRLEEREAEIASIDRAVLVVTLSDGRAMTLAPGAPRLAAQDGDRLQLLWGDTLDLSFTLPATIATSDVTQSQFVITGYYERYTSLLRTPEPPSAPDPSLP